MTKEQNPRPPGPSSRPDPPPAPPLVDSRQLEAAIDGLEKACERYRQVIERLEAGRRDAGDRILLLEAEVGKLHAARTLLLRRSETPDRVLLDQLTAALE